MTRRPRTHSAAWWFLAPLAAVIAYRSVTAFDFVADARFLILDNAYIRGLQQLVPNLVHDYFWSSSGNQIPYYRPVTKGSWVLEHLLFGDWAGGFLLVQLAFHVLGVLCVQALARALGLSRGSSLVAGLVYALHPVAIEPVSMIMARSDVVAATGVIGSVLGWLGHRRTGRRGPLLLHVLALALAVGSKEQAAFLPALLALRLVVDGSFVRQRARALWALLPSVAVLALYLLARKSVLAASGMPAGELAVQPLRLFTGLSVYLPNTWLFALTSSVRDVSATEALDPTWIARGALVVVAVAGLAAHLVRKRDADGLTLLAWALLALGPVLLTRDIFVPTEQAKYAFADRWLAHALAPATLLWLHLLRGLGAPAERVVQVACAGWAVVMLAGATAARAEFGTELAMLGNEDRVFYLAIPQAIRTPEDRCRHKVRKVARASLQRDYARVPDRVRDAMAVCGERPELALDLLRALSAMGRFAEAAPLAQRLLAHPPTDRRSHADLQRLAAYVQARSKEAPEAPAPVPRRAAPPAECRALLARGEAARQAGDLGAGADLLVRAFECGGGQDVSILIAAATALSQAGDREAAGALLDRLAMRALTEGEAEHVRALRAGAQGQDQLLTPVPTGL